MTILIVDDAQTVRMYHREILESVGFSVAEASNGLEGLEYLQRHGEDVQALLLDINMPQMDGYTFLRELRQQSNGRDRPVIMISTEAEMHDREMAFKAGANGYFVKPVQPDDLARSICLMTGITPRPVQLEQE